MTSVTSIVITRRWYTPLVQFIMHVCGLFMLTIALSTLLPPPWHLHLSVFAVCMMIVFTAAWFCSAQRFWLMWLIGTGLYLLLTNALMTYQLWSCFNAGS